MSKSNDLKQNGDACPIEVFERHGDFSVCLIQGRVYARLKGKNISVSKLVWQCNRPNGILSHRQQIYHKDGNKLNNKFENLTLWRVASNKKR